ncbi:hypothetical protein V8G54_027139 [Vigna mungo]|uniref:Uncharacterized protein n=1 Tax=Vigna mungo TaxID=3915 RepID=A0AAQ3N230_VIGMU
MKSIERFEEEVFDTAKDEAEYITRISTKMKGTRPPFQSEECNLLPSQVSGSGYGNAVQEQTSGETTPVISNSAILTPPLLENCNKVKEHFQDHSSICDDSSPAMQHLIKVLTSISAEALMASCGEIGMIFHLSDDKSTLEPLNGQPIGVIDSNSKKENHTLSEEIKEINKQLIDTEVVIDKNNKIFPTTIEAQNIAVGGEGLTVKLFFNSVTVNLNSMSKHDFHKKDIAMSWDHCARETICEYAELHGGGTFTSKYGGWQDCLHDS